jgi:hypothetical protein|tara:strand:- start:320 stop:556 length:237 start_codon:yes stop_codon:yes gene_type:complete
LISQQFTTWYSKNPNKRTILFFFLPITALLVFWGCFLVWFSVTVVSWRGELPLNKLQVHNMPIAAAKFNGKIEKGVIF